MTSDRYFSALLAALVFAGACVLSASPVAAQFTIADCSPALAKDYEAVASSRSVKLHLLRTIDRRTWEERRRSADANAKLFGLIELGGSYDDFNGRRESYLASTNYQYSEEEAFQSLRIVTSDRAYTAYETCLKALAFTSSRIVVIPKTETQERLVLSIKFWDAEPNPQGDQLTGQVVGGTVAGVASGMLWSGPRKFKHNVSHTVTILRTPGADRTDLTISSRRGLDALTLSFPRADGVLRVRAAGPVFRAVGTRTAVGASIDMHDVSYSAGCFERNPGGGCAAINRLAITAAPGNILADGKIECRGIDAATEAALQRMGPLGAKILAEFKNRCNFWRPVAVTLENNGTVIAGSFSTWTRPAFFLFTATEKAPLAVSDTVLWGDEPLTLEKSVRFAVPNLLKEASIVELKSSTGTVVMRAGDPISPGGRLTLLGAPIDVGVVTWYTYVLHR